MNTKNNTIYVIVSALQEEMEIFKRHFNLLKRESPPFTFYEADIADKKVVFSVSGVGKVSAAMITQRLIDVYAHKPDIDITASKEAIVAKEAKTFMLLIFSGVAAALNPSYEIGDIVLAEDCIQYDLDASELGFPRGTIPYTSYRFFKSSKKLLATALECLKKGAELQGHKGRILTADLFLNHKKKAAYKTIFQELGGDAVEMEGAALAQVATLNKIPFIIIRSISDKADEKASQDFAKNLPGASENCFRLLCRMLDVLE